MKLFVYGTLKSGFRNHRLLGESQFLGNGVLLGFQMFSTGGFPCAVNEGEGFVHGEIYEVPDALWPALDRLEGVPHMYRRETELVNELDGDDLGPASDCQVYVWNQPYDQLKHLPLGIWV